MARELCDLKNENLNIEISDHKNAVILSCTSIPISLHKYIYP